MNFAPASGCSIFLSIFFRHQIRQSFNGCFHPAPAVLMTRFHFSQHLLELALIFLQVSFELTLTFLQVGFKSLPAFLKINFKLSVSLLTALLDFKKLRAQFLLGFMSFSALSDSGAHGCADDAAQFVEITGAASLLVAQFINSLFEPFQSNVVFSGKIAEQFGDGGEAGIEFFIGHPGYILHSQETQAEYR
jgi:hypothetical protein